MSLLTNGKLAGIIGKTLGSNKLLGQPITIRRPSSAATDADGCPLPAYVEGTAQASPVDWNNYRRGQEAIPAEDRRFIVYQHGASFPLRRGYSLVVGCEVYEAIRVTPDPAGASWDVQARPV
jgi:hypothetical protein